MTRPIVAALLGLVLLAGPAGAELRRVELKTRGMT